jgi:long-chain acyl-CoA synthetase
VARRVQRLSVFLKSKGIRKGSRLGLLSENRPEWVLVDLAAYAVGASVVPLYPQTSEQDIRYILEHSECQGFFISTDLLYQKVKGILPGLSALKFSLTFDPCPGSASLNEVLAKAASENDWKNFIQDLAGAASPEDEASVIYTSGTTGPPKGVVLTHRNFLANVASCAKEIPVGARDRTLSFLPLSHVFERTAGYYFPLSQGAEMFYAESMSSVPENLKEVRPTIACSVPRLYEKIYAKIQEKLLNSSGITRTLFFAGLGLAREKYLLQCRKRKIPFLLRWACRLSNLLIFRKIRSQFGGRLRFFISGGAPLSKEIAEFFYMTGIMILEGYGLTETAPVLTCNRLDRFKFGTVGLPVDGVQVRIAQDGEILAKGENIMKGYLKDPEATRSVLQDGWFATGDIGTFDSEGFLKITDRKKDIIVSAGGKNIAPQNIENTVIADKFIAQIVVIGDKRPYLTALIVPGFEELRNYASYKKLPLSSNEELLKSEEIRALLARRIAERIKDFAHYEQIQYSLLLPQEFTLEKGEVTPTLKIRRRVIMEKYKSLIERLYTENPDRIPVRYDQN